MNFILHQKANGLACLIVYDGQSTNVLALVTSGLSNEIVLSWRALQRLGVLPENYPTSQYSKANQSRVNISSNDREVMRESPDDDMEVKRIPPDGAR